MVTQTCRRKFPLRSAIHAGAHFHEVASASPYFSAPFRFWTKRREPECKDEELAPSERILMAPAHSTPHSGPALSQNRTDLRSI